MRKENEEFLTMLYRFQFMPDETHLPLANTPERFVELLKSLSTAEAGKKRVKELAEEFGITTRQINFYGETGSKTFGLFDRSEPGVLKLTPLAEGLAVKEEHEQYSYLQQKLMKLRLFRPIRNHIDRVTLQDVIQMIEHQPLFRKQFSDSSIKRRASTLLSWARWFEAIGVPLDEDELATYIRENEALIYEVVHRIDRRGMYTEEYFSAGTLGYQKALLTYHPDKDTKFSTYAFTCMQNEILYFRRKELKWNVFNHVAIDQKASGDDTGNGETGIRQASFFSLEEKMESTDLPVVEKLILDERSNWLQKSINKLTPVQQEVVRGHLTDGLSQLEVSKKLEMSQANVSKIMTQCKKLLKSMAQEANFI